MHRGLTKCFGLVAATLALLLPRLLLRPSILHRLLSSLAIASAFIPSVAWAATDKAEEMLDPDLEMAPQVPLAATLTFHASVEVDSDRLFLGNVAVCSGMRQICDEAYGIDLGPNPEPGRTVPWHPERARALLAKEWPGADIRFAGAKVVKISATAIALSEERVEAALKAALGSDEDALSITVDRINLTNGLRLRPGDYTVEFPDLTPEHLESADWVLRNLSGNQRLTFLCRQQTSEDTPLSYSVSAHMTVRTLLPVTAHSLAKGADITAEDLKTSLVPISRGVQQYMATHAALVGRRTRRVLPAGVPFLTSDTEQPRVIKRGQLVTLQVSGDDIAVTGQVKVMSDGFPGQIVEAQYPATKKKIRVRIVNATSVQYVF